LLKTLVFQRNHHPRESITGHLLTGIKPKSLPSSSKPCLGILPLPNPGRGERVGSRNGDQVSNKGNRGRRQKSREWKLLAQGLSMFLC
jgi:hypothetical protein